MLGAFRAPLRSVLGRCSFAHGAEHRRLFDQFRPLAPFFPHTGPTTVINTPREFYDRLLSGIDNSRERIVLSSLYLGAGDQSKELVSRLVAAKKRSPSLRIVVVLDCIRAARSDNAKDPIGTTSVAVLQPLIEQFDATLGGETRDARGGGVFLFHSPRVTGVYERFLPNRFNELPGVHHIKTYMFDNDLVISGANLSENYFTNRRDRCILLNDSAALCDHYDRFFQRVLCCHSHRLTFGAGDERHALPVTHQRIRKNHNVTLLPTAVGLVPSNSPNEFRAALQANLNQFICDELELAQANFGGDPFQHASTWLFSTFQAGDCRVYHDSSFLEHLLKNVKAKSHLTLTSPYLNLTRRLKALTIASPTALLDVITASPRANGFFTARGASSAVPAGYVVMERQFYDAATKANKRFTLHEYTKPQWTFHAKGMWYSESETEQPVLTTIGSPNFGARSVHLDTEAQLTIVTCDQQLKEQLNNERNAILTDCIKVPDRTYLEKDVDHQIPLWANLTARIFKFLF